MNKNVLGKGLGALIPQEKVLPAAPVAQEQEADINLIYASPNQPRKQFNEQKLQELADSIREKGIIQPIIVNKTEKGFEIIAGERRFRAAKLLDFKKIPVIIRNLSKNEAMEVAIIENIQREDLNPIEEAEAYRHLSETYSLTQEDIAKRVGKDRSTVANLIRILKLPEEIRENVSRGTLSLGHARALLAIENPEELIEAGKVVIKKGYSVRDTEKFIKNLSVKKSRAMNKLTARDGDTLINAIKERLQLKFGTKVSIKGNRKKGKIEIEYFNQDDMNRILDNLGITSIDL